ncbi:MAG: hypothetical protein JWL90_2564 [Chthoniobacteraceae bacterium]|nr:hypothetical protein [Chthoniobacteraceae bacterium]
MQPVAALARARRICAIGTAAGVVFTVALLIIGGLAALDLMLPFPRAARIFLSGIGAMALLGWMAIRWDEARRRHTHATAAKAMESAHPEFGQQFRTALELVRRGVPANAEPEAKLFAAQLISQAEEALGRFSWNGLVPRGGWIFSVAAVFAIGSALAFGASHWPDFRFALSRIISPVTAGTYTKLDWMIAPGVFDERHPPRFELRIGRRLAEPSLFIRERGGEWVKTGLTALPDGRSWDIVLTGRTCDLELYATAGDARTPPHKAAFQPIAKLIGTRVHLLYPGYTGLPAEERKQGDVSVVEDTRVRWDFTFNIPPKTIEWRIGSEPAQRLSLDPATLTASVEWTADTNRSNAAISVLSESGEVIDSWRYTAEGFVDALPTVELLEPVKDQEATSITELPVRIRARDDFGVSEVGLVLESAGQREWVLEKVISERDQRNVSEMAIAMLEKVPLTLRDNVRLYAYALDHKPRGGPRAVSPLRSIDIREFKKRWIFRDGGGGGGSSADREKVSDGLMKLGAIITAQRGVVSDTFLLRENSRSSGVAVTASALPIGQRESELGEKAGALGEQWLDAGGIPQDDVALLDTARAQMEEASQSLGLRGPANVGKGFATTDRALTTLLQLRKKLLTILMKGEGSGEKPKPEDQIRSLAELAKEAERLAREERDVRGQLSPEAAAGTNLDATRRQHEIVVSDGGELYAAVVDHPQTNDAAIRLMGDAERAFRAADETLHGPQSADAVQPLETAEHRLLEAAEFLRAMELTQAAETLKQLAGKAEKSGESIQDSGDSRKGTGSSKAVESPARRAARDTTMADEILGALAEKAGGSGKAPDSEADGAQKSVGETLSELRDQVAPGKIAGDLKKLAASQEKIPGGEEAKALAGDAAGQLSRMAREFRDAAQRLEASRAAKLAAAQAQAQALEKQIAAAGSDAGKPSGKPGDKPGAKGGANAQKPGGKGDLAKGDKSGKAGADEKPEDGKQSGQGGIAGDLETAKEGPGGQAMGRFSMALRSIGDEKLNNFAIKLFKSPFSLDSLPLVEEAARRIAELVAALPAATAPLATAGRIPESRRREVEDYFRNLSDDFGSEQWDAAPAPGEKTE